jgi:hypothetical protein
MIEVRGTHFYLNGDRVRLTGVERMAGSNPEYGMAEPVEWLHHDHADMKGLNCVYTRVHWQQDRRVLDWCDRHGILIQVEVPAWGSGTFKGMTGEPGSAIMNNGLEQLREMIARDRNHPCIFPGASATKSAARTRPLMNSRGECTRNQSGSTPAGSLHTPPTAFIRRRKRTFPGSWTM